jgi:hypothetical protein
VRSNVPGLSGSAIGKLLQRNNASVIPPQYFNNGNA